MTKKATRANATRVEGENAFGLESKLTEWCDEFMATDISLQDLIILTKYDYVNNTEPRIFIAFDDLSCIGLQL